MKTAKRKSILFVIFCVLLLLSAALSGCEGHVEQEETTEEKGADWGLGLTVPRRGSGDENQSQNQDSAVDRLTAWSDEMKTGWAEMFPDGRFSDIRPSVEEFVWIDEIRQLKGYADRVFVHYVPFEYALAELPVLLQIEAPDLASGLDEWLRLVSEGGTDMGWQPFLEQWLTEHEEQRTFLVESYVEDDKYFDHYGYDLLLGTRELCDAVNGGIPEYLYAFAVDQHQKGNSQLRELLNEQEWRFAYDKAIGMAGAMAGGSQEITGSGQNTEGDGQTGQDEAGDERPGEGQSFMNGKLYETFADNYTLSGTLSYRTFAWDWNPREKEGIILILDQPIQVMGYSSLIEEIQLIMDGDAARAMDGSHLSVTGRLMDSADTSDWIRDVGMMVDTYQAE